MTPSLKLLKAWLCLPYTVTALVIFIAFYTFDVVIKLQCKYTHNITPLEGQ